jgi:hypothetical protein
MIYSIHNWHCDCGDSVMREGGSYEAGGRRVCKHVIWLSQLYPCPNCKGFMLLRNEAWKVFQCCSPACYTMIPFQTVKAERQQAFRLLEQEADVVKTHTLADVDNIIQRAEYASSQVFAD